MKLLLFSILLLVVYSWDETKRTLFVVASRLLRQKRAHKVSIVPMDQTVGSLLALVVLGLTLIFTLSSNSPIVSKLLWMSLELILVAVLVSLPSIITFYSQVSCQTSNQALAAAYSLFGLVSPAFRINLIDAPIEARLFSRFAFLLALPPALGLVLKQMFNYSLPPESLLPQLDVLIFVLVGAMFIRIIIKYLETHFRLYRYNLFAYFRVLLGVVISFVVITGLV